MRQSITFTLIALCLFSIKSLGDASPPVDDRAKIDRAFVPVGFDTNDIVEVVVTGKLDYSCLEVGKVRHRIDYRKKRIYLSHQASHYHIECEKAELSYFKVVSLGVLPAGKFRVYDSLTRKYIGRLQVNKTDNPSPDNYLYARVENAHITKEGSDYEVVLSGVYTQSCHRFEDARVQYHREVVVVLPILEKRGYCRHDIRPFEERVRLKGLSDSSVLVHIRAYGGKSLNRFLPTTD